MGLVIRQSIITTIISYCGVAIGYINLLYLYPKFLSPEEVGLFRTIQDAAILLSPFAQFGLASGIFRYYPQFAKDQKTSGSFISLMLLLSVVGFAIFFVVFQYLESSILSYFNDNAKEIIHYASLVLWLTLILLITSLLEAYSRSLLKTIFPNLLREVVSRLFLSLFVLFYFLGYLDFQEFIISTTLGYLVCLMALIVYLARSGDLKLGLKFSAAHKIKLPELLKYSLLSFAGTAGLIIIGKVDSIMVSGLLGLAANAVYTTAFYMATVIEIPKRALSQVAMPLIARAFEKKDLKDIQTLYQKTAINQFIIGALILIGVWANLDNIFQLIPKSEIYEAGKYVVMIVGFGKLVDMIFGPSSEIIVLSKYYSFNILLIILLAGSIVFANNLLIPVYGINGAAIGAALALIFFNFTKFLFIWATLKLQPFSFGTIKIFLITVVAVAINLVLPKVNYVFIDIIYRSSILTIVFGILVLLSNASPDGNNVVKKILSMLGIKSKGF
ncbi:MAG: oligosaccharide flippase family protein [Bacteroidia bacterium]|nr:oligosaccharide flippase family protein [Bacteroidia bacterium]